MHIYNINSQQKKLTTDPTEKEMLKNAFELGIHSFKYTSVIQLGVVCPQRLKLLNLLEDSSIVSTGQ